MTIVKVRIDAKSLLAKLKKFPVKMKTFWQQGAEEAAAEVLDTTGIRRYPPATAANQPPTPYYQRGVGTVYKGGTRHTSQRYGSRWKIKSRGYTTVATNTATYAKYLVGDDDQAKAMAKIGWRKLGDVSKEKRTTINSIMKKWIRKGLKELGLK